MSNEGRLSKIDVARRQLETAIRLFFARSDPVSVFTLGANAWEVIDALCTRRGIESISKESREHVPAEKDLKRDYVNSPFRNFFKHANRDPDEYLEDFDEWRCDGVLFLAVEDYIRLMQKSPVEFQVFQLWYLSVYVEKVAGDALERVLEATEQLFPNIRDLPREDQVLAGARALEKARANPSIISDPRTEQPS